MKVAAGLALCALALAALAALWWTTRGGTDAREDAAAPAAAARPDDAAKPAERAPSEVVDRRPGPALPETRENAAANTPRVVSETPLASGTVRVSVRWRSPAGPAVGVLVRAISTQRASPLAFAREATSGADGIAVLQRVPLGPVSVRADRSGEVSGEVRENGTLELALVLERGLEVRGRALDPDGRPVGQAEVFLFRDASDRSGARVAGCDNSGGFQIAGVSAGSWLQARARERAPSALVQVVSASPPLELTMGGRGATLLGQVLGPDEVPLQGAAVCVLPDATPGATIPQPWFACATDDEGRFAFPALDVGHARLVALFPELAPYDELLQLVPTKRDERVVQLAPGAGLRGKVQFEDGAPAAGVVLRFGSSSEFLEVAARSLEDGSFVLRGLPAGPIALEVGGQVLSVSPREGELAVWNPTIARP